MTATNQDIGTNPRAPFMSGDSRMIEIPVVDETGAFVDLGTAVEIRWELFAANGVAFSGAALVQKSLGSGITVAGDDNELLRIAMLPADTADLAGAYYHESQLTMADGSVYTPTIGRFVITRDAIE